MGTTEQKLIESLARETVLREELAELVNAPVDINKAKNSAYREWVAAADSIAEWAIEEVAEKGEEVDRERCEELINESVDSSEHVIYTHKTWNVCWSCDGTEWDEAQENITGMYSETEAQGVDRLLTVSAYWLLVNRAIETMDRLIEEREEVAA